MLVIQVYRANRGFRWRIVSRRLGFMAMSRKHRTERGAIRAAHLMQKRLKLKSRIEVM